MPMPCGPNPLLISAVVNDFERGMKEYFTADPTITASECLEKMVAAMEMWGRVSGEDTGEAWTVEDIDRLRRATLALYEPMPEGAPLQ